MKKLTSQGWSARNNTTRTMPRSKAIRIVVSGSKDLFGGRENSQAHRINLVLIKGRVGTAEQIAKAAKEPVPNVSAQLSWLHGKGLVARKKDGRRFIYRMSRAVPHQLELASK